jgi:hypothetical protein
MNYFEFTKDMVSFDYKSCDTHNELSLFNGILTGGRDKKQQNNADLLVLLDGIDNYCYYGDILDNTGKLKPKEEQRKIFFPVKDMGIPADDKNFKTVIDLIKKYLDDGKRVHIQCIGGHGRTGMFIACLVGKYIDNIDKPIEWTRENYCTKAVESLIQIEYVEKFTGKKEEEIKGSKDIAIASTYTGTNHFSDLTFPSNKTTTNKTVSSIIDNFEEEDLIIFCSVDIVDELDYEEIKTYIEAYEEQKEEVLTKLINISKLKEEFGRYYIKEKTGGGGGFISYKPFDIEKNLEAIRGEVYIECTDFMENLRESIYLNRKN